MDWKISSIGIVHSSFKTKEECPIQGSLQSNSKGIVEVFQEYEEGLNSRTCPQEFMTDSL